MLKASETTNPIYLEIIKEINAKRNAMVAVTGPVGKGKSTVALRIANDLDPSFTPADRVIFTASGLLDILNSADEGLIELPKGSVIIFDETGVGMGARDFFKQENKELSAVFQTFRNMNLVVIFTMRDKAYVDKQLRGLFDFMIEVVKIDFDRGLNIFKFHRIQYSGKTKEYYTKRLIVRGIKISKYELKPPAKSLVRAYEKIADAYKAQIRKDSARRIKRGKARTQGFNEPEAATEITDLVLKDRTANKFLKLRGGKLYMDHEAISIKYSEYGVGMLVSGRIAKRVKDNLIDTGEWDNLKKDFRGRS